MLPKNKGGRYSKRHLNCPNFTTIHCSKKYIFPTGFAYVGGACVVNKRLEKVNSVAIIEDTGGFSGIIVAAHEVGHL